MTFVPQMVITVVKDRLHESIDLTQPVSAFLNTTSFLVITQNTFTYTLSIGKILNFIPNIDLTQHIGQAFASLFSDVFIAKFQVNGIPRKLPSGLYNHRLSVLNPFAYKDYQVHFTSINNTTIRDDVNQKGFLDDLAIVSDHDMSNCLVAVNGVLHRTAYLDDVLYVLDGFRTIRLSGKKDVVVVDTQALGGHTIIPLTTNNVTNGAYQTPASINVGQSILGKTVFAVIDGYFYHRDQDVLAIADNTHLKLKTSKLPLIQQLRHNPRVLHRQDLYGDSSQYSRKYTDPYELTFLNKREVPSVSLENAAFQYSRLTAYHSFLVVLNNPNIFTVSTDVVPTGTPKLYSDLSNRNLSGMLNYGCGLCPSYLIWRDPSDRKSIFLPEQDYDVDWQNRSIDPSFIPTLIRDISLGAKQPHAQFIDYVSA